MQSVLPGSIRHCGRKIFRENCKIRFCIYFDVWQINKVRSLLDFSKPRGKKCEEIDCATNHQQALHMMGTMELREA